MTTTTAEANWNRIEMKATGQWTKLEDGSWGIQINVNATPERAAEFVGRICRVAKKGAPTMDAVVLGELASNAHGWLTYRKGSPTDPIPAKAAK